MAALLVVSACGRTTVSFTFGGDPSRLDETTVMGEPSASAPKIALIDLRGLIVDGPRTGIPLLQSGDNPVDELVARLARAERDPAVRGVVIRINSPGGAVTASDTMYREVRRFREASGKPVVMSLGEVAASGGYYVALAGDEILAQPTSITGSIGVIIPTVNFADGLRRIGIVSRSVKSGANKDLANPLEPMRDGQYQVLQGVVDHMYARFRALVVERRAGRLGHNALASESDGAGMSPLSIDELTDGRVLVGEEAARQGLVDGLTDLRGAFERACTLAGVRRASLVKYHAEGDTPKSAYSLSPLPAQGAGGGTSAGASEINLVQVQLGAGEIGHMGAGVAYYVWSVGAW